MRFVYSEQDNEAFVESIQLRGCTEKTNRILDWFEEPDHSLQRFVLVMDQDNERVRNWLLDLGVPGKCSPEFDPQEEMLIRIARAHGVLDEIIAGLDDPVFRMPKPKFDNDAALEMLNTLRECSVRPGGTAHGSDDPSEET